MRPETFALMDALGDVPVYILGRRTDVLAANAAARAVLTDFNSHSARERNAVRWVVLDESARSLWGDGWETAVAELVGALRMDAARFPDDPKMAELVGELSIKSEMFRKWWGVQRVVEYRRGQKVLHHPLVGELTLQAEDVTFPGEPDQTMFTYLAKPGSPSETALKLFATWSDAPAARGDVPAARAAAPEALRRQ